MFVVMIRASFIDPDGNPDEYCTEYEDVQPEAAMQWVQDTLESAGCKQVTVSTYQPDESLQDWSNGDPDGLGGYC